MQRKVREVGPSTLREGIVGIRIQERSDCVVDVAGSSAHLIIAAEWH